MPILTLTTDWGLRDHYLASFKGELLRLIPSIHIIDVSHEIEKFNTMQAAFVVQNSYHKFPKGTIHFLGMSCNENCPVKNPFVVIKSQEQYLLGEDNGMFTLILGNTDKEIVRLPIELNLDRKKMMSELLKTIKKISEGIALNEMGTAEETILESYFAKPTVDNQTIRGTIIYIDSFGNAIVNITKDLFINEIRNRKFIIHLRKSEYNVMTISQDYEDVEVGEMLALFNQDDFLEISLNKGSASQLLGLKHMDPIRIEFHDHKTG